MSDPRSIPFALARTLLVDQNYPGLFIGERHDIALAPDFLITHMEAFRDMGVTTLYVEMDHGLISSAAVGPDCAEAYAGESLPGAIYSPESRENDYADVIAHAQSLGIRVIGTERSYDTNPIAYVTYIADERTGQIEPTPLGESLYYDASAMAGRDAFAASVVQATRDEGRFIVYGGANHSRAAGADPSMPSPGIDTLLGIPSIDLLTRAEYELVYAPNGTIDGQASLQRLTAAALRNLRDPEESTMVRLEHSGRGGFIAAPEYFLTTRYPERDPALTDAPSPEAPPLPADVTAALKELGACETPAPGELLRSQEDLPQLRALIDTQYTR